MNDEQYNTIMDTILQWDLLIMRLTVEMVVAEEAGDRGHLSGYVVLGALRRVVGNFDMDCVNELRREMEEEKL